MDDIRLDNIDFSVAILAGGKAKRFGGKIKSLLTIDGRPIIEIIADSLSNLSNDLIVVTDKVDICRTLKSEVRCVKDLIPNRGPLSGLHAALVTAENNPVFICGGDMPFVKPYLVKRLYEIYIKRYIASGSLAMIPRYSVRYGVRYDVKYGVGNGFRKDVVCGEENDFIEPLFAFYSKELIRYLEDYMYRDSVFSLHDFIGSINCDFYDASEDDIGIFTNINTPGDYLRIKKSYKIILQ